MTEAHQDIVIRHIAAQTRLDRRGEKRRDREWLEAQRHSPDACFCILVDQKPAIVSDPDRTNTRLRRFSPEELAGLGINVDDAYFLGARENGGAFFMISVSPAEAAGFPGGPDAITPPRRAALLHGMRRIAAADAAARARRSATAAGGGSAGPAARTISRAPIRR
jgi:hypothetical protein